MNARPPLRQAGISMLEVLVALIVISLGLLGVAAMQAAAINNTGIARSRSLGAIAADSMAASMHANNAYWAALTSANSNSWTVTSSSITGAPIMTLPPKDCAASSTTCNSADMAVYDTSQWGQLLGTLPGGSGQIACAPSTTNSPASCLITVSWQEKLSKVNAASMTAAATSNAQYQMVVVP
ncbi:type IV pilus modification protein PilV [Chromobacterium alticapitis]|nr:type IV pilus modification protein PilV [Chromobacterium alticapitis]